MVACKCSGIFVACGYGLIFVMRVIRVFTFGVFHLVKFVVRLLSLSLFHC